MNAVRPLQKQEPYRCNSLRFPLAQQFYAVICPSLPEHHAEIQTPGFRRQHPPRDHLYTGDCSRLTVDPDAGCAGDLPSAFLCKGAPHLAVRDTAAQLRRGHGSHIDPGM